MNGPGFRLSDYDWVGFDLDNTLCEYDLTNLFNLEYDLMKDYLVTVKNYCEDYFPPLDVPIIDFICRGVFVDFTRGNVLRVDKEGTITKAVHGTSEMSVDEIVASYGNDCKWEPTTLFCRNPIMTWDGPTSEQMRSFLDFTDAPAALVFAEAVDYVDETSRTKPEVYNIWPDLLDAIVDMYGPSGPLYKAVTSDPMKYIVPCDTLVIDWIKRIKCTKKTFLITGSDFNNVSFVAERAIGPDWMDLFDLIVCSARKPKFFTDHRPFKNMNGELVEMLNLGEVYTGGNWSELYRTISNCQNGTKCVYFGDNLIQDIYAPSLTSGLDAVAVVDELSAEKLYPQFEETRHHQYLTSHFWGPYLGKNFNSVWGNIVVKHSKLCVPNLRVLAKKPLDHLFTPLWYLVS